MDLFHQWGSDLSLGPTGDLLLADGDTYTQQRLLRRYMTNQGDDTWDPAYGAGLPQEVGRPIDTKRVKAVAQQQALLEESVAQEPPPVVQAVGSNDNNSLFLSVKFTRRTGENSGLSVGMERSGGDGA
ncbi:phage tail protein [Pseudoroseomonas rhizosphaerae]|uniref:Phage tail protein n=1 Tax=Teichococcus rhizosphaerae TaxID=1335062 RepID=A0A2C6ZYL3_9PROT|nr:phage tail protein [Pseudoroseomonas rhizosphaerae]PHK92898.1 phage tail protein [Pseudoroseomonas rhizosphaerae]